jgi:hypothetical protein
MLRSTLIVFALLLVAVPLAAQNGTPSAKATADISTLVKCNMTTATNNDGTALLPGSCTHLYTGAHRLSSADCIRGLGRRHKRVRPLRRPQWALYT